MDKEAGAGRGVRAVYANTGRLSWLAGFGPFVLPAEGFEESKQYEITFWAKNDTNKAQTDIYAQAIADFQELYPNITVNLRLYTDYGKIYNDV